MSNKIPASIYDPEDIYQPLESTEGWCKCILCNSFPKVWVFDNGNFAKCGCYEKYQGDVSAPSVMDWCYNQKKSYDDYKHLLRDAWNVRCNTIPLNMWKRWLEKKSNP
jgi:hypothetical protein